MKYFTIYLITQILTLLINYAVAPLLGIQPVPFGIFLTIYAIAFLMPVILYMMITIQQENICATIEESNLAFTNISGANFKNCDWNNAKLKEADLTKVNLTPVLAAIAYPDFKNSQ